jgi:hypothetical protein
MRTILRAEDLQITEYGIDLGGRSVLPGSILSLRVEKRVSAELLGYLALIAMCVAVAILSRLLLGITAGALLLSLPLALGARWEITRPYVIVLDIFQAGLVEVRGYARASAVEIFDDLEALRTRRSGAGAISAVGYSP